MQASNRHIAMLAAFLAPVLFFGCTKEPLTKLSPQSLLLSSTGTVTVNFCTDVPTPLPFEDDYIVAIDTSTTNALNCQETGFVCNVPLVPEPGTNPNGDLSFGVIDSLLGDIQLKDPNDPNVFFELFEYGTTVTDVQGLTNNLTTFKGVVDSEWANHNFSGWTDLSDTLTQVNTQIQNIINSESGKLSPTRHRIVVILMGDGVPEVLNSGGTVTIQATPGLVAQVTQMESLVQQNSKYIQSLTFNTVYNYVSAGAYNSFAPQAQQLFQQLAAAGYGQEYNAGNGQLPPYNNFLLPKINNPYKLQDIFVHNLNTEWTASNLDGASDGQMSDTFRIQHGASPAVVQSGNPDSDGNGVSDLVEFTLTGTSICNDSSCNPLNATNYQNGICGSFIQSVTSTQVTFTHNLQPNDIFNDCELTLLHGSTNTELIRGVDVPQDVAALLFYPITGQGSTSWLNSSPFEDGYTSYQKMKYNINPLVNASSLVGLKPYQYSLTFLGQKIGPQDCYQATVSDISLSYQPNGDTMQVFVVETGVQSTTSKVRVGSKKTDANGNTNFADTDLL